MLKKLNMYIKNKFDMHIAFYAMCMSFAILLVFSNFIAGNIIEIAGFALPAAVIVFPATYILGDAITEVFGFKKVRALIIFTLIINIIVALIAYVTTVMPHPEYFEQAEAYSIVFAIAPRTVLASSAGFLFGSLSNAFLMHLFKQSKKYTRLLWLRVIVSTIVGEFLDTCLFITIVFIGVIPTNTIIDLLLAQYLFKVLYELVFSPILVLILKRRRKVIDVREQFDAANPSENIHQEEPPIDVI